MREKSGRAALLAVVTASFLLVAATAFAANTNISIQAHDHDGPNGHFNGIVKSSDPVCDTHVTVTLYRDAPQGGSHFHATATDGTNSHGKWSVDYNGRIPRGTYYATSGEGDCPVAKTTRVKIQ